MKLSSDSGDTEDGRLFDMRSTWQPTATAIGVAKHAVIVTAGTAEVIAYNNATAAEQLSRDPDNTAWPT